MVNLLTLGYTQVCKNVFVLGSEQLALASLVHRDISDCSLRWNSLSDFYAFPPKWKFINKTLQFFLFCSSWTVKGQETIGYFQYEKPNLNQVLAVVMLVLT